MRITVIGADFVGLVTSVSLAQIGHTVIALEPNHERLETLQSGLLPIYEPGLKGLMKTNMNEKRLFFTDDRIQALKDADVIYIAAATPLRSDGTVDVTAVEQASIDIATTISQPVIVVLKSTVPIGMHTHIESLIKKHSKIPFQIVLNPEFSRRGNAIHDTFYGDRIVLGSYNNQAMNVVEELNIPFQIPIFKTDFHSAEVIKYAANAFLATRISFINEIASLCEKVDANIDDVAFGIGLDNRIGEKFLEAGIGFASSCFTNVTADDEQSVDNFRSSLLQAVMEINDRQQSILMNKAIEVMTSDLTGKKIAVLGLSYKPNTDELSGAVSIRIINHLLDLGADVISFDPVAIPNARKLLPNNVEFVEDIEAALKDADAAFILTQWDIIKDFPLVKYEQLMSRPLIFDGRNCYPLDYVRDFPIEYYSIGRPVVIPKNKEVN